MRDVRLPEFPCVVGVEVRFRDLDAMGHVNNAVYLTFFEQARLAFWMALHPGGAPGEVIDPARIGFVVARAECDYASPVRLGERLLVGCRAGDFGTSSFAFDYRIVAAGGSVDAEVRLVGLGPDGPGHVGLAFGHEDPRPRRAEEADRGVPGRRAQGPAARRSPGYWILTRPEKPSSYPW